VISDNDPRYALARDKISSLRTKMMGQTCAVLQLISLDVASSFWNLFHPAEDQSRCRLNFMGFGIFPRDSGVPRRGISGSFTVKRRCAPLNVEDNLLV
jgi:hypothetical protein